MSVAYGPCSTLVVFDGELDLATLHDLREEVDQLLAFAPSVVVLDLARVEFIDSMGVVLLLQIWQGIVHHQGGTLEVAAVSPAAHRVLDMCGLAHVFTVDDAAHLV